MKPKFKVGDKVKIICCDDVGLDNYKHVYLNEIFTVIRIKIPSRFRNIKYNNKPAYIIARNAIFELIFPEICLRKCINIKDKIKFTKELLK